MDGQENRLASLNLLEITHDDGAGYLPRETDRGSDTHGRSPGMNPRESQKSA